MEIYQIEKETDDKWIMYSRKKVVIRKYNNRLCILEKSETGTSTNFGHTIGNVSFCFLGGVANLSLINYDITDTSMIYKLSCGKRPTFDN